MYPNFGLAQSSPVKVGFDHELLVDRAGVAFKVVATTKEEPLHIDVVAKHQAEGEQQQDRQKPNANDLPNKADHLLDLWLHDDHGLICELCDTPGYPTI